VITAGMSFKEASSLLGRGSELEPPIGIEPMTYALREGLEPSSAVQRITPTLIARLRLPSASTVVQVCC